MTRTIHQDQRQEIARQIGGPCIASISGGRVYSILDGIELPAGSGYWVRVQLTAGDVYTVTRIFRRNGQEFVHGQRERVFGDEVGEAAYYAGMFRSYDDQEWVIKR